VHVVVEANVVVTGDAFVTLTVGEQAIEQVDRLVGVAGRGIRAEIAPAVVHHAAGDDDPGPCFVGDLDVRVGLAVLEQDVVLRLVLLDQLILKDQRLGRRVSANDLEIRDMADQLTRFGVHAA
jgi:hypothetical protein